MSNKVIIQRMFNKRKKKHFRKKIRGIVERAHSTIELNKLSNPLIALQKLKSISEFTNEPDKG